MNNTVKFFIGTISLLIISRVSMAEGPLKRIPTVQESIIDQYAQRTIVNAQVETMNSWTVTLDDGSSLASHVARANATIGKITLDDGSVWLWNARFEPPLNPLIIGQTVTIEWKPQRHLLGVGYGGYYIFATGNTDKKVPLFSQPLLPLVLPLIVKSVESVSHGKIREPTYFDRLWRSEGDFKTTALITLSDKSKWIVSLVQKNTTATEAVKPLAEVGTSAQIVWTEDAQKNTQPAMVVQQPVSQRTLIIEGTH